VCLFARVVGVFFFEFIQISSGASRVVCLYFGMGFGFRVGLGNGLWLGLCLSLFCALGIESCMAGCTSNRMCLAR